MELARIAAEGGRGLPHSKPWRTFARVSGAREVAGGFLCLAGSSVSFETGGCLGRSKDDRTTRGGNSLAGYRLARSDEPYPFVLAIGQVNPGQASPVFWRARAKASRMRWIATSGSGG